MIALLLGEGHKSEHNSDKHLGNIVAYTIVGLKESAFGSNATGYYNIELARY